VSTDLETWEADAARTDIPGQPARERLLMGAMGLLEEARELNDLVRVYDRSVEVRCTTCLLDEAGDALWYASALARAAGGSLAEAVKRSPTEAYVRDAPESNAHRVLYWAWVAHRAVKRHAFQGHPLHQADALEVAAGVWSAVCALAHGVGRRPAEALEMNVRKRAARYPNGYDAASSAARPRSTCPTCGA
jgi:NTP pyrophosphatase (non-canonical NTP hydrolase)